MAKGKYDGPTCFVGHDQEAADGRFLAGGWHYTVVEGPDGSDMPGEMLYLDDQSGEYRLTKPNDESWRKRKHEKLKIIAPEGNVGLPVTKEEVIATHEHLDELERRINSGELLDHEHNHVPSTAQEVQVMRGWLNRVHK